MFIKMLLEQLFQSGQKIYKRIDFLIRQSLHTGQDLFGNAFVIFFMLRICGPSLLCQRHDHARPVFRVGAFPDEFLFLQLSQCLRDGALCHFFFPGYLRHTQVLMVPDQFDQVDFGKMQRRIRPEVSDFFIAFVEAGDDVKKSSRKFVCS